MPRYQATVETFVVDRLYRPGDEFSYDGPASRTWTPLDAAAEKAQELALQDDPEAIDRFKAAAETGSPANAKKVREAKKRGH